MGQNLQPTRLPFKTRALDLYSEDDDDDPPPYSVTDDKGDEAASSCPKRPSPLLPSKDDNVLDKVDNKVPESDSMNSSEEIVLDRPLRIQG